MRDPTPERGNQGNRFKEHDHGYKDGCLRLGLFGMSRVFGHAGRRSREKSGNCSDLVETIQRGYQAGRGQLRRLPFRRRAIVCASPGMRNTEVRHGKTSSELRPLSRVCVWKTDSAARHGPSSQGNLGQDSSRTCVKTAEILERRGGSFRNDRIASNRPIFLIRRQACSE
jgi:hypothetical protein